MSDRSRYDPKQLIVASLRSMVRSFDGATVSTAEAVALVDWFASVERLAVAGKTLAAGRAAEGEPWRSTGDRSAADWLAKRTGSTVGDARGVLDTASNLQHAPHTDDAFRSGALSPKQAEAVASAAAADRDPDVERRLLDAAGHVSLQKLRDESARVRAAAEPDPNKRHERIRRARFWRRWTDADGARRGSYSLTPDAAAILEACAQRFIDAATDQARRSGEHEPSDALAADGLVAMAASTAHEPTTRSTIPNQATSSRPTSMATATSTATATATATATTTSMRKGDGDPDALAARHADPDPEAGSDAHGHPEAEAHTQIDPEADPDPHPEPDPDADVDVDPGPEADPHPDPDLTRTWTLARRRRLRRRRRRT